MAAANLRITTSKLEKTDNDGVTGFQKHFQVITVYETLTFLNNYSSSSNDHMALAVVYRPVKNKKGS